MPRKTARWGQWTWWKTQEISSKQNLFQTTNVIVMGSRSRRKSGLDNEQNWNKHSHSTRSSRWHSNLFSRRHKSRHSQYQKIIKSTWYRRKILRRSSRWHHSGVEHLERYVKWTWWKRSTGSRWTPVVDDFPRHKRAVASGRRYGRDAVDVQWGCSEWWPRWSEWWWLDLRRSCPWWSWEARNRHVGCRSTDVSHMDHIYDK